MLARYLSDIVFDCHSFVLFSARTLSGRTHPLTVSFYSEHSRPVKAFVQKDLEYYMVASIVTYYMVRRYDDREWCEGMMRTVLTSRHAASRQPFPLPRLSSRKRVSAHVV
jgi:hypothetical protein